MRLLNKEHLSGRGGGVRETDRNRVCVREGNIKKKLTS